MKKKIIRSLSVVMFAVVSLASLLLLYREFKKAEILKESSRIAEQGGISEHREILLNGKKQHIVIEGKKKDSPILLFLHGGPGMPVPYGASSRTVYPKITKDVTAVYWDQRGAGKSFEGTKKKDLTIKQMVEDTVSLTKYLRKEFKQEKIHVLGLSWGTVPGLLAVHENPELYRSYFSYAQATNMNEGNQIVYDWLTGNLRDKDMEALKVSSEDMKTLRDIGEPPFTKEEDDKFSDISDRTLGKNEIAVKATSFIKPMLYSPDYTLPEIYKSVFKASQLNFSESNLTDEMMKMDLKKEVSEVEVPITFLNGKYDKAVPLCQVRSFMNGLKAPEKELIVVEHSSHMPSSGDMDNMLDDIVKKILAMENMK